MHGIRSGPGRRVLILVWVVVLSALFTPSFSAGQTSPHLKLVGVIRTTPFVHTQISMRDGEGSAYVPRDHSLWLADDGTDAIFEVAPRTGRFKRVIEEEAFRSTHRFGGGPRAGATRTDDFESMAYDEADDALYVFSGKMLHGNDPTDGLPPDASSRSASGRLVAAAGADQRLHGRGWNSADHRLYVAGESDLRMYDYASNALGQPFQIADLSGIFGLSFSRDGSAMYAVTHHEVLDTGRLAGPDDQPAWSFDLTPFGVRDSRAVERIGGRFFVLDGATRNGNDRRSTPCSSWPWRMNQQHRPANERNLVAPLPTSPQAPPEASGPPAVD
jgi:hypothetical protein